MGCCCRWWVVVVGGGGGGGGLVALALALGGVLSYCYLQ